jgi:hypothetical protein
MQRPWQNFRACCCVNDGVILHFHVVRCLRGRQQLAPEKEANIVHAQAVAIAVGIHDLANFCRAANLEEYRALCCGMVQKGLWGFD